MKLRNIVLLCVIIALGGCAGPAYKEVFLEKDSYNSKEFPVSKSVLYQATSRTLCSKNFNIDKEDPEKGFLLAKRSFQRGKRTIALIVQAKMEPCIQGSTMLYLNAIETKEVYFVADRTRFLLFIIPLPGGGGKEGSQIKEGERVIEDKEFYKNFFEAITQEIKKIPVEKPPAEKPVEQQAVVVQPEIKAVEVEAPAVIKEETAQEKK